ncbi:MAG: cytochrome C [Chloroflexi bacterium]|nr:cytochrome C [Chloroflexota bacterium]MDA1146126.1 cytochrome C [Chloroflexota bacterium]
MTDVRSGLARPLEGLRTAAGTLRRSAWAPTRRWIAVYGDRWFPIAAALLITASIFFPYWRLKLNAPQYPRGLEASIGIRDVAGDVSEIDGLNHYIGMRPLAEGGKLELSISIYAIPAMAGLAALAAIRRRRFWLFALPAIAYPVVFTADLYYWLYDFGHTLDPTAALSNAFDEFTPTLIGPGRVGQFTTFSFYEIGFGMAFLGSVLLVISTVVRVRRERAADRLTMAGA